MALVLIDTHLLKELAAYVEEQREYVEDVEDARAREDDLLAQVDTALAQAPTAEMGIVLHHDVRDEETGQARHVYIRLESGGVGLFIHDSERGMQDPVILTDPTASAFLDVYDGEVRMHVWRAGDDQNGDPTETVTLS